MFVCLFVSRGDALMCLDGLRTRKLGHYSKVSQVFSKGVISQIVVIIKLRFQTAQILVHGQKEKKNVLPDITVAGSGVF